MALYGSAWPWFEDRGRIDELFRSFFATPGGTPGVRSSGVYPPVNLYDDGASFLLRAELPGVERDALEITVKGNQVTLRGERKSHAPGREAAYHRREAQAGQFRRVVTLPEPVAPDAVRATFENGVLELVLPRVPEALPRKINLS